MRLLTISLALLVAACGGEEGAPETRGPEAIPEEKPAAEGDPAPAAEDAPAAQHEEAPVDPRIAALEAEYGRYDDKVLTHSAAELDDGEKQMLRHLLKAASLIEELHMLQIHPENMKWHDEIQEKGSDIEKKVFFRYQMPWCADDESPECTAVASKPAKEIGKVHWPVDLTDEEFEGLGRQINGRELLSPFTVVVRNDRGGFDAVPFSKVGLFADRMRQVAAELRAAAETAPHGSLKKFLSSRAAAFEATEAFPYDDSDYDWIALEGDWEVTVGPYETYKNPRQLKAMFEMYIGREDKEITAELARFKDNLQAMEDALGELVGKEIYKSRKLDPRIAIRAVEIWMASGDGRRDRGATVAFHLPNRGKSVDEGLYKKVMMVNHSLAFEEVMQARAKLVLAEDQQPYVDVRADITNVTFHEFAHGFGAYHEMKVKNPKGKTTTVKEALREHDSLLEEEKADTFGLWLLQFQRQNGWVDEEQAKKRYVSALMHLLGLLQYPLAGTYPRMVAIQLGWYLDHGAVTWDAESGRFAVVFDKIPGAVESLAKHVATIQLTGDHDAATELVGRYIEKQGEKDYALMGTLAEARAKMLAAFEEAGIRSPSLRYEVTGL